MRVEKTIIVDTEKDIVALFWAELSIWSKIRQIKDISSEEYQSYKSSMKQLQSLRHRLYKVIDEVTRPMILKDKLNRLVKSNSFITIESSRGPYKKKESQDEN